MASENTNHDQDFDIGSDHPQTDPDYDAFGYAPFAKKLANIIQKNPNPHGLVIGLHGEWGSGKSSVLNFVKHYLTQVEENNTIAIEFNPWWFNDSDDLARQFLATFYGHLETDPEKFGNIREKLKNYGETLGNIFGAFEPTIAVAALAAKHIKFDPKSIGTLKKELSKSLENQQQRFLFLIDDIDRLSPSEIRDLFKIIKALADFPKVTYLLAFDRKVVSESLNKSLGIDGDEYLEKIVQLQLALPMLNQEVLDNFILAKIKNIIYIERKFNARPSDIENTYSFLKSYIKKPRDAVRIINSIGVLYPSLDGEVDPGDFITIEFIRIFDLALYELIKENKAYFLEKHHQHEDLTDSEKKDFHERWLSSLSFNKKKYVSTMITKTFPEVGRILAGSKYISLSCQRKSNSRIFCPSYFDIYFQFNFPTNRIGNTAIKHLISLNIDDMRTELLKYSTGNHQSRFSRDIELLEFLMEYNFKENDSILKVIHSLLDIGDELTNNTHKSQDTIIDCIFQLIKRLHKTSTRRNKLSIHHEKNQTDENFCHAVLSTINKAIDSSNSIALISEIFLKIKHDKCPEMEIINFEKKWLARIHSFDIDYLIKMNNLLFFLDASKNLDATHVLRKKIELIINNNEKLPLFLERFVHTSSLKSTSKYFIQIDVLDNLIDNKLLIERINAILIKENITQRQKEAARLTLDKLSAIVQRGS